MGFTLGSIDEMDDPQVRCVLAIDEQGTVHGVTSWLPAYSNGVVTGWTLDFMRRRSGGFKGAMEFLISASIMKFQAEGCEFVSLNAVPLSRDAPPAENAGMERLLEITGRRLEPVYGFRSLRSFKAKFQPTYLPLFLLYPEPAVLPRIGTAVTRAYLPNATWRQVARALRQTRNPVATQ